MAYFQACVFAARFPSNAHMLGLMVAIPTLCGGHVMGLYSERSGTQVIVRVDKNHLYIRTLVLWHVFVCLHGDICVCV